MKKSVFSFLILFLLAFTLKAQILPAFGDSRTGTTGMQFLKIAPDARSAGMGESFIAIVNDVSALYWNPAGLTKLDSQKLHFQVSHTEYFSGINMDYLGMAYRINDKTVAGISLLYLNSGEMDVTTSFLPFGTGQTFRATDFAASLSLARMLTENFSFGITAKYLNERIESLSTHNAVFDFGFQYDIGLANIRFAVGLYNFGFNTRPQGELEIESLNGITTISDFEQISVPGVFRIGLAWDAVKREEHLLIIAAQLNHPTDNNETYSLGIEYGWKKLLFIRTGYIVGKDVRVYPSFGFGLDLRRYFGNMKIDYGFNVQENLGGIHRISLGFSLLNKKSAR